MILDPLSPKLKKSMVKILLQHEKRKCRKAGYLHAVLDSFGPDKDRRKTRQKNKS